METGCTICYTQFRQYDSPTCTCQSCYWGSSAWTPGFCLEVGIRLQGPAPGKLSQGFTWFPKVRRLGRCSKLTSRPTLHMQPSILEFPPQSSKWQNDPLVWRIGCGSGVSHCLWRDIGPILDRIIYFYCCKFPFCNFCVWWFSVTPQHKYYTVHCCNSVFLVWVWNLVCHM